MEVAVAEGGARSLSAFPSNYYYLQGLRDVKYSSKMQ